jgi:hypothetical protein
MEPQSFQERMQRAIEHSFQDNSNNITEEEKNLGTHCTEKIKTAMRKSCKAMLDFTDNPALPLNAEYLFTTIAALELATLNCSEADPYSIFIEHPTSLILRDLDTNSKFRKRVIGRKGRVDVVVYSSCERFSSKRPLCIVETKGFNPRADLVLLDIKRNCEILGFWEKLCEAEGSEGGNRLPFHTLVACLHAKRIKPGRNQEYDPMPNIDKVRAKYNTLLRQAKIPDQLDSSVEVLRRLWKTRSIRATISL